MAQKQLAQHSFSRNSPSCFAPSSAVKNSRPSVNAMDQLSLSLLQARLIDLKLPIKIVEGT